jgi:hypothetical protein
MDGSGNYLRPARVQGPLAHFCGAKQRQGHAVTPSLKQGLPAHALLFCQFFNEVAQLGEDEFFHREADRVF